MSDLLTETVRRWWGYDSLRAHQREAMESVLLRRDSVTVLPTGGGKSLCFQAPALCMEGMAVVVSPLIALMKDQVDQLTHAGIEAAAINSSLNAAERRDIHERILAGRVKLLYVAPERLVTDPFIQYLRRQRLAFIAIDEAHCISQWGHDFRPEYRQLGLLREAFPDAGIHAYTATATPEVRDDIARQLSLREPVFQVGSFHRPNLAYRVMERQDPLQQVEEVMQRRSGESGIVYCIRRKDVEQMCQDLAARGYHALPYHAGLDDSTRRRNQDRFIRDDNAVMVATVAFGMGIDKPNVRFVVHAGMPKSLEHYQQESGRAGRDGLPSECVLLFSRADYQLWRSISEKEASDATPHILEKLGHMLDFCTRVACRHKALALYFGENLEAECSACDVCLGEVASQGDSTPIAKTIAGAVREVGERFGGGYLAKLLCAESEPRIRQYQHQRLAVYGALKEHGSRAVRQWIDELVAQDILSRSGEYSVIGLTSRGLDLLRGDAGDVVLSVAVPAARRTSKKPLPAPSSVHPGLREHLRGVRRDLAEAEAVPPYIIVGDASLDSMAALRPITAAQFALVHGIGDYKLKQYGEAFMSAVRAYCVEHGLDTDLGGARSMPNSQSPPRKRVNDGWRQALPHLKRGASLEEVGEAIGRARSTCSEYLVQAIRHGEIDDITPWVRRSEFERITAAAENAARLRAVFDALEGSVSYEQIKIALAFAAGALEKQH